MKSQRFVYLSFFCLLPPLLVIGILGGVARLGWGSIYLPSAWLIFHGLIMVTAFLGTLIGLERAAQQQRLLFAVGLTLGGSLLTLIFFSLTLTLCLILLGIALHLIMAWPAKGFSTSELSQWLGLFAWLGGVLNLWFEYPLPHTALWWGLFLVLTIRSGHVAPKEGEETSPGVFWLTCLSMAIIPLGCLLIYIWPAQGFRLVGLGLLLQSGHGLMSIRVLAQKRELGSPSWLGVNLACAYIWLGFSSLHLFILGEVSWQGWHYDGVSHGIFVGFVFGMIFTHAPGMIPRLLGKEEPVFHPLLWGPPILLQIAVVLRSFGGFNQSFTLKAWGGLLSAVSLSLFFMLLILLLLNYRVFLDAYSGKR